MGQRIQKMDLAIWIFVIMAILLAGASGIYIYLMQDYASVELDAKWLEDRSEIDWKNYPVKTIALGDSLKIVEAGVYVLSGKISDGGIAIDTDGPVKLILNNVNVANSDGPAIEIHQAQQVMIYLPEGTHNSLADGGDYAVQENATATGTIYSKAKLEFDGPGAIDIRGESNHAVVAKDDVFIYNGCYNIVANQDAINGKKLVKILGGDFEIEAGDDAIHADEGLQLSAAVVDIVESYEGLEAPEIVIDSGEVRIKASDDGINAADGTNDLGMGQVVSVANNNLVINGGEIYVNADGDGLDANGSIYISGGKVIIEGPTSGADGALDYDGELQITGGTLLAIGSRQMAQGISNSSTQYGFLANLVESYDVGAKIEILNDDGIAIMEWTGGKKFDSIVFSSNELTKGKTYIIKVNDVNVAELIIEDIMTSYGQGGMMEGGRFPGMRGEMGGEMPQIPQGEMPEAPNDKKKAG